MRLHRSTLPGTLIPTSLYAKFDRIADGIRANERALAQCRHALAPGVPEIVVLTPRQERERRVARAKSAAVLERARTEGRKEAYVASGVIDKLLAHPTPSAVSGLVTASSGPAPLGPTPAGSVLSQARADCSHPLHGTSQRVQLPDGSIGQIFTGV